MNVSSHRLRFLSAAALLFLAAERPSLAGSATWSSNPTSGDWNTAANWIPQTVPNSTTDVATFGPSNVTDVINSDTIVNLDSLIFSSGSSQYTITAMDNIAFYGTGIVNSSGVMQSFVAGVFIFNNSATAGIMTTFSTVGGFFDFEDFSSAGSAAFNVSSDFLQGTMFFWDSSTAGDATINASAFSDITFHDSSTGGNATLNLSSAAFALFGGSNNAERMNGNCLGGAGQFSSQIDFEGSSSAGDGTFTAVGGSTSGEAGAFILFEGVATASNATFIINGGMGAGLTGTALLFIDNTTAANANITANGGVNGSDGGVIFFQNKSKGGKASITLNGNSELDISARNAPGVTIGSLSGRGSVLLGANTLTIGTNNQSTTFSGVIQDSGGLTKSGIGTLTLSAANTYAGNTTVSAGVLVASNRTGSATGTGPVNVNAGTLGGKGTVSGAVTIGTGSGGGAVLAPGIASNQPAILTCENTLSFKADSTYTYKLNTRNGRADQVVANGVTIESGAQFDFNGVANKRLANGTVFTAISNTSANPLAGTFANLADNSIFTVGRNKYQANYEGGDGNDLTLTVVP
jgi:autotransporter-associated beta strand protein